MICMLLLIGERMVVVMVCVTDVYIIVTMLVGKRVVCMHLVCVCVCVCVTVCTVVLIVTFAISFSISLCSVDLLSYFSFWLPRSVLFIIVILG